MFDSLVAGRYRLTEPLGSGGMATVWRARDEVLGRAVAVKMLAEGSLGDASAVERFQQEAQTVAGLGHPNIVTLFDAGIDGDLPFLVMELVEGADLRSLVERGPIQIPYAVSIADQVCAALEAAHRAGVVHRDIKPANLLLTRDGTVKVVDFGIARTTASARAGLTTAATVIGSSAYMAPEQATGGDVDARTDLYALGCVLYATLTGRPPFEGDDPVAVLFQQVHQAPVPPGDLRADVPAGLERLVMDLLEKDPNRRPADAATVRSRLSGTDRPSATRTLAMPAASPAYAPGREADRAGGDTTDRPRRTGRRGTGRLALLGAGALAVAGLTGYLLSSGPGTVSASAGTPGSSSSSTPSPSPSVAARSAVPVAPTTTAPPAPASSSATARRPSGSVAAVLRAVAQAQRSHELAAGAAQDLRNRLRDIGQTLAQGQPADAARKLADLKHHLTDLQQQHKLDAAGAQHISAAIATLAATLRA